MSQERPVASDKAAFIPGERIAMNGGHHFGWSVWRHIGLTGTTSR